MIASLFAQPQPILCLLLALTLVCLFGLFFLQHSEVNRLRRRVREVRGETDQRVAALEDLVSKVGCTPERSSGPASGSQSEHIPLPAMNLTRRSQVLQRLREGQDPVQIAAGLGIAAAEVRLVEKIQKIVLRAN